MSNSNAVVYNNTFNNKIKEREKMKNFLLKNFFSCLKIELWNIETTTKIKFNNSNKNNNKKSRVLQFYTKKINWMPVFK